MYVCTYVWNDRVTECTRVRRVCTAATSGIPACTYAHVRAGYAQLVRLVWQTAGTRGCVMVTIYTYIVPNARGRGTDYGQLRFCLSGLLEAFFIGTDTSSSILIIKSFIKNSRSLSFFYTFKLELIPFLFKRIIFYAPVCEIELV